LPSPSSFLRKLVITRWTISKSSAVSPSERPLIQGPVNHSGVESFPALIGQVDELRPPVMRVCLELVPLCRSLTIRCTFLTIGAQISREPGDRLRGRTDIPQDLAGRCRVYETAAGLYPRTSCIARSAITRLTSIMPSGNRPRPSGLHSRIRSSGQSCRSIHLRPSLPRICVRRSRYPASVSRSRLAF
jgi:hypothetical protein